MSNALGRFLEIPENANVDATKDPELHSDAVAVLDDFEVLLEAAERITKSSVSRANTAPGGFENA